MPTFPRRITKPFSYPFSATNGGLYAIRITATCRSGNQTGQWGGEDLRVEIDGMALREIPAVARTQQYNIPSAWNGTELKDLPKTVIFVLQLKTGEHELNFVPYRGAQILEEPLVQPVSDPRAFTAVADQQVQDGDRRPWYTIALVNLPLKTITLDATVQWRWRDSDDLKLIIDNKTKPNPSRLAILRRDWLLSGSLLKRLFNNQRQQFTFDEKLPEGIHYIELWADRKPKIHRLELDMGEIKPDGSTPQHNATITDPNEGITEVNLRTDSSTQSDVAIAIPVGQRVTVVEEGEVGEYVTSHTDRWHKITYDGHSGYVLSFYVDIDGQTTDGIKRTVAHHAKQAGVEAEHVLALAECESHFKPYAVSEVNAKGVMQLSEPLLADLNDRTKPYYSPVDNPFDFEQNVRAGVSYFAYLYERYKDNRQRLEKTVAAYNTGPGEIPVGETLELSLYAPETQRLVECVQTHLRKRSLASFSQKAGIAAVAVGILAAILSIGTMSLPPPDAGSVQGVSDAQRVAHASFTFQRPYLFSPQVRSIQVSSYNTEPFIWRTNITVFGPQKTTRQQVTVPGAVRNTYLFDLAYKEPSELLVLTEEGQLIKTRVFHYDQERQELIPLSFVAADDSRQDRLCCQLPLLKPRDNGVQYDIAMRQAVTRTETTYRYSPRHNDFREVSATSP